MLQHPCRREAGGTQSWRYSWNVWDQNLKAQDHPSMYGGGGGIKSVVQGLQAPILEKMDMSGRGLMASHR